MYYIYILHSTISDKYYVGYTDNVERRVIEHNTDLKVSYTSKHRPWELKGYYAIGEDRGYAMKVERYIKKLKSRKIIEELLECDNINFILRMLKNKFL